MRPKGALAREDHAGGQPAVTRATWAGLALLASWRARAPWWFGIGGGALLVMMGALARSAILGPSDEQLAYLTFWPAVMIAALVGGLPAGAMAVILSCLLVHSVFVPLDDLADWLGLFGFLAGGGFLVGVTDLLLRTRAQALAAEETEALKSHLAAIVESSSDPILSISLDGTITSWNAAAERLFGYDAVEIIGQPITVLNPPAPVAEEAEIVARLKKGERIDHFETSRRAKNGRALDISLCVSPIRDSHGDIVGASMIMRDITERKAAEEARRTTRDELHQTLNTAAVGLTRNSRELRYLSVNPGYAEIAGLPIGQIEGRPIVEVMGEKAFETIRPYIERVLNGERVEYEAELPWATVGPKHLHVVYTPWIDAEGAVTGWVASVSDVTARKKAEAELREADRRKDEFLAMLAHELRNPLAPIRNGLHILQLDGADGAKAARARDIMARQVDHLVRLVDDLLEVSRISRGRIELRKGRFDLAQVINDAVAASQPHFVDLGHHLKVALPTEPLPLEADPMRLAQVLTNLLNNAGKFSKPGGRIAISAKREDGEAVVSIRDSGVGIPADELRRIFDLFTQIDRGLDHSRGGLGIGLALARNLVEMHGGRVDARSEGVGRGSEFIVRLPLADSSAANPPVPATEAEAPGSARRVLVVDDDRDVADSFAMLLESLTVDVRVAYDGRSALDIVAAFKPDLVFLDLGMPKMDGCETARRIRQLPDGRSALLVALTGWGQNGDRRRTREAGFDKHLVKPADFGHVQALLGERR